jgi:hypothetical protein
MNIKLSRFTALSLAAAVILTFATGFQARAVEAKKAKEKPETKSGPTELLRRAYGTLAEADHDYKGHRIDAMKDIEEAGKILGINLHGDDHDHEKQGVSDEHLREAQHILAEAKAGLTGKALKHVNAAEKQLNIALRIK